MSLQAERAVADRVRQFLESAEWLEAFETYRHFIVGQIEAEESPERVQRLLAHLRTARAVRIHLESLVKYGAIAAKQIEFEEKREEVKKRFPWLPPW